MEANLVSIDRWMDKEEVGYICIWMCVCVCVCKVQACCSNLKMVFRNLEGLAYLQTLWKQEEMTRLWTGSDEANTPHRVSH